MSSRFSDQVILVAGGTGGLGRAVSLAFLQEGAQVAVTYRNQDEFGELQKAAGPNGSALKGFSVDVTDEAAVRQLVGGIVGESGKLDAVVNAVGGYGGGKPLWDFDTKLFDQMLALNLRSGLILARAAVPVMVQNKRGSIVNVVSKAAVDHAAGTAAYAASKAAALAMTDSLAEDVRGSGVRVNSILPSIIDTETNRKVMPQADFAKWPKPEEIARVILFLCSEDARVVHGAAIPVYGGL